MKALAVCALSAGLIVTASHGMAQEPPHSPEHAEQTGHEAGEGHAEGPSPLWAWANFLMLAGILGYMIAKKGGPWFAERSESIRRGIAEAEKIRAQAEASAAEVSRRLAGLQTEIEKLRTLAREEQAAEAGRIREQIASDLARMQQHTAREIESAGKAARVELKRYAAQLAIDLAEQKIRRNMTPEVQAALVDNFARNLELPSSGPHPNK